MARSLDQRSKSCAKTSSPVASASSYQLSQICDRMVGEPTVYTQGYFDAFRKAAKEVVDAAPLLAELRMIKTPQEIERMRIANDLAAIGMAYARKNIRPA